MCIFMCSSNSRLWHILMLISTLRCVQSWRSYCSNDICLYFNEVNDRVADQSQAEENCSSNGYKLLEIYDETYQALTANALISWNGYNSISLGGFYFRMNLQQVDLGQWKWLDDSTTGVPTSLSPSSNVNFATIRMDYSLTYAVQFERTIFKSICSYSVSCPSGALTSGNTCLTITNDDLNWFEARKKCLSMGGDLLSQGFPSALIANLSSGVNYWIGLTKARYVWKSTGKMAVYTKWNSNEPLEGYSCSFIYFSGDVKSDNLFWAKSGCSDGQSKPYVCMNGTAGTTPTPSSTTTSTTRTPSTSTTTATTTTTATPTPTPRPTTTPSPSPPPTTTTSNTSTTATITTTTSSTSSLPTSQNTAIDVKLIGLAAGFSVLGFLLILLLILCCFTKTRNQKNSLRPLPEIWPAVTIGEIQSNKPEDTSSIYYSDITDSVSTSTLTTTTTCSQNISIYEHPESLYEAKYDTIDEPRNSQFSKRFDPLPVVSPDYVTPASQISHSSVSRSSDSARHSQFPSISVNLDNFNETKLQEDTPVDVGNADNSIHLYDTADNSSQSDITFFL